MLRELTKNDWQRILAIPDERIPQVLILRGTRNLKTQSDFYRQRFSDVMVVGSPNGLIEDVLIGEFAGGQVAYASIYGSAMASEVTHLFGVMGTKFVVQTGCCGAWAEGIQPGDLFIPTKACCGEGAAQYYVGTKLVVAPTLDVVDFADSKKGPSIFRGGIYTTAALFAEGIKEVEQWADDGWDAVDMETATTFAVAEHFGMDSASILFAFDNPRQHADIVMNDAEKDERRRIGNAAMIDWTFRIVERYFSERANGR
jgi:uridine phosphorylase